MFTQGEIEQVMAASKTGGASIDFDWFDTIVENASELGVIRDEVEVDVIEEISPRGGGFRLLLVVNGNRLGSRVLRFEEEWEEEWAGEPVSDSVLRMLALAVAEIKNIQTVHNTSFVARSPFPVRT